MGIGVGAAMLGAGAIGAGASIFGGLMGASGAKKQAEAIRYAADRAEVTARDFFKQGREDTAPFRATGTQATKLIDQILAGTASIDDLFKESSLYGFESDLGTRSINRQLSSRGMYGSGAGLESLALFEKGLVAEEGNRYFDKLFSTAQLGANVAVNQASIGAQTGSNIAGIQANAGANIGQAYANQYGAYGSIGQGVAGAASGVIGDYTSMQYLNRVFPPGGGGGGGGGGAYPSSTPYDTLNIRGYGGQPGFSLSTFNK